MNQLLNLLSLVPIGAFAQGMSYGSNMTSSSCEKACAALHSTFGHDRLHYPENDNFNIWDAKQQEVRPACRVEPSSASEVAQVLHVLVEDWCRFAVKGGGHSRNPDDSNSVGGVTIDLGRLSSVEVVANATRAKVGGGANSVQVYSALEPYDRAFVGGRVRTVGVGGHALGGGSSPFANRYGWALDNVYEYEVVLANGTTVTASENFNSDLYWALRGGGNNFSIVTTFTIGIFPQGPLYQEQVSYAPNYTEQVLDKVYDLWADSKLYNDLDMSYDMYYAYNATSDQFAISGSQRYLQPIMNASVFEDIRKIPSVSRRSFINTISNLASSPPSGVNRNLFGTLTVSPSRELLSKALGIFREEIRAIGHVVGLVPNFICYPIHKNTIAAMSRRGGNALGIVKSDEPLLICFVSTAWTEARGDSAVWDMTRNIVNRVKALAVDLGVSSNFVYMNYAWAGQANEVFAGYGEENAERLRDIQKAVDPRGIFTLQGLWRGFMKLQ